MRRRRRHTNTVGHRQIRRGKQATRLQVLARKLGVPFKAHNRGGKE